MIDLYCWPTPNGHKITLFLEEAGLDYTTKPSTSALAINSIPSSWRFLPIIACPPSSTTIPSIMASQ
jgi:GST-like protein